MNVHQKSFIQKINCVAKKTSRAKIFDDFLTIASAALDQNEELFATVDDKKFHCELLADLAAAINYSISEKILRDKSLGIDYHVRWLDDEKEPKYRDVLGEIFRTLELYDQAAGQVFTPQHTADLAGKLTIDAELARQEIQQCGFVSIVENCCGSGALIFGSLNSLLKSGINPCHFARVLARDIDPRCVKMTFIQLSLYCIPAIVEQRNVITDEKFGKSLVTPILKKYRVRSTCHD